MLARAGINLQCVSLVACVAVAVTVALRVAVALTLAYRRGGVASDGSREKGTAERQWRFTRLALRRDGRRSVDDGFFITVVFSTG